MSKKTNQKKQLELQTRNRRVSKNKAKRSAWNVALYEGQFNPFDVLIGLLGITIEIERRPFEIKPKGLIDDSNTITVKSEIINE